MKSSKVSRFMLVVLTAAAILAACAPAAPTEAPAAEAPSAPEVTDTELNVLCTPQEQWCQGMKQEFESKYGITVNYVRMSSGESLARLEAEKENPQFDIWWGGPIDSFVAAKREGLLEAVQFAKLRQFDRPGKDEGSG